MDLETLHKKFLEENPKWNIAEKTAFMLRKCREESKLSQSELAKKMHTKQSGIARAESTNPKFTPTLPFIERFANACGRKFKMPEII